MLPALLRHFVSTNRGVTGKPHHRHPRLETLEDRLVPYVLSGYTWANPNVSVSYMPDGTLISSTYASNLFAVYNAAYPQATWQREIARALQTWADVSNLNFHFVADDGSPQGTAGLAQGDSRFGDIRIGGYNMGSGILGLGWNPGSTTTSGDVELSTTSAFAIGSMPDLASVIMHEVGHGIGFNHSLVNPAVMEGGLWGVYPGPYADDVAGVQAMYGVRKPDAYDAAAPNDTLATATALTLSYGGIALNADITTMADVDYYKVVAPPGANGTLTVSVDARNLSLFDPKVSVYNSSGTQLATASASTYGDVATVNLTGLIVGQTYYLMASGATTDVFGMGAYKLSAQFGGLTAPTIGPDSFEPNNTVASATNFGTVTSVSQTALTLNTSADVDYYTATAGSKSTYTVTITPTQGSGMLGLTVLNAQQAVLASGQSQTGGVTLSLSLASGQQYYVKVVSPTGSVFRYSLSIAKAGTGGGAGGGGGHHLVVQGAENPDETSAGDFFYQSAANDPDYAGAVASSLGFSSSPTQPSVAGFGTVTKGSGVLRAVVGVSHEGAGSSRSQIAILVNLGPQTPPLLGVAPTVPAAVPARSDQDPSRVLVPGLQPSSSRMESGGGGAITPDDQPDEMSADGRVPGADAAGTQVEPPAADPASTLADPEAVGHVGVEFQQRACDACFTRGFWRGATRESRRPMPGVAVPDSSPTPGGATAAVALAVAMGGCGGALQGETDPRRQRRLRI
jgi:hypothetical protein